MSWIEINVSKRTGDGWDGKGQYEHFFATAERSIEREEKAREVYAELAKAFPEPAYKITVTAWETQRGNFLDLSKPEPDMSHLTDVDFAKKAKGYKTAIVATECSEVFERGECVSVKYRATSPMGSVLFLVSAGDRREVLPASSLGSFVL